MDSICDSESTYGSVDIDALARHSSSRVRAVLAGSSTTPPEILRFLADDQDSSVKLAAALNPACPVDVLEKLSLDSDWSIRLGLAAQLDVCEDILLALARSKNPYLSSQARHALNALTMEGKIKGLGTKCRAGSTHKLGQLLVCAKKLNEQQLSRLLVLARSNDLRLGRVVLQAGIASSSAIVECLRIQRSLRQEEIEFADACELLSRIDCGDLSYD